LGQLFAVMLVSAVLVIMVMAVPSLGADAYGVQVPR